MDWNIEITNTAQKDIRKIPQKDFVSICAIVESMKTDPFIGDRQKLRGRVDEYRRRVGSWRVFFHVNSTGRVITIKHIRRRDSRTYSK